MRGVFFSYWGALLAVVVASTALLVGCGGRSQSQTTTTVTTPVATLTPTSRLALRPITLPPGFHVQSDSHAFSLVGEPLASSPVDGKDAWACVAVGTGAFQIWVTADEGATWHAAGLLHPQAPAPPVQCGMVADRRDRQAAVFKVEWWWGSGAGSYGASMSFYTRDGGAYWRQLPGWSNVFSVDTDGGTTYALVAAMMTPPAQRHVALLAEVSPPRFSGPGLGPFDQEFESLVVSSDGLQTWRELQPGGVNSWGPLLQFWRGPTSGELFVAFENGQLWHSLNGGSNWTQVSTQGMQISLGGWLASRKTWMFCGGQGYLPVTMCSMDTGNSWQQIPGLARPLHCAQTCSKNGEPASPVTCLSFALASDGSLLAACPPNGAGPAPGQFMAYRLDPGATGWTVLGPVPSTPQTVSANGIIWCLNAEDREWETTSLPD